MKARLLIAATLATATLTACETYSELTGVRVPCQRLTKQDAYSGNTIQMIEPCPIHSAERLDWTAPFLLGLVYQEGAPGIGLIVEIVDEVALIDGLGVKVDGVEYNLRAEPLDTYVHIGAGKLDWTRSRTVFVVKPEFLEKMVSGNRVLVQLRTTRKGNLTGDFSKGCQTARGTPCGTIREFLKDR